VRVEEVRIFFDAIARTIPAEARGGLKWFARSTRQQAVGELLAEREGAPLLLAFAEASAAGVVATGPRRGCRIVRVRGPVADVEGLLLGRLCAQVEGYNLQAATRLAANDRDGLERMCRYLARPPIATDLLSRQEDGRLELRLKRPWRDGTIGFLFTPHELLERIVALVPRPRAHLTRYPRRAGAGVRAARRDRAAP
jgi:hypothetical protein